MRRTLIGIASGASFVVVLVVAAWAMGWVQVPAMAPDGRTGTMPPADAAAAADEPGQELESGAPATTGAAEADTSGGMADEPGPTEADMPEGAVMISPERQQLIGVRTAPVERRSVEHTVRTVGTVEYDETRVAHIHTKISGWIDSLHVDFTGELVQKGQPLLEIYSPELVATQEEYLLALRAQETLGESPFPEVARTTRSLLEATRRRLLLWDVTEEQIAVLEERREPQTTLSVFSPIEGFVIHKNAYEGQHVGPDTELYTIADLSEVWVSADVYESDLPYVRLGQRATVTLSYLPQQTFRGRVDYVYPYLAGETRTAKVRVVLPNHDATLKPDMFANVQLNASLGESLVVPEDAVIDTGERQVAFLVLDGGHFLPREVQVGLRFQGQLQIVGGLEEGDVVVSGAAFLVDSESKLRSALRNMTMNMDMD